MLHDTERFFDDFLGAQIIQATNVGGPWAKKDTSSSGAPTMLGVASENTGALKLLLASTGEEEILTLYWSDYLGLSWDKVQRVTFRLKASAITTNEIAVFGLASAQNDTENSVAYNAWFRLDGGVSVLVETDDGSTDDDDNDTGVDISAGVYKEFVIDFSNGIDDVRFFVTDAGGNLRRVLATTTFSMAGATGTYCQPFVQLHKASGSTTPYVTIDYVDIEYKR
jgi:hypothetical protein